MFNRSVNPQVIYSLTLLSDTLWILMKKRPLEEITVSEICKAAYVSRNSFYRNCETKEDLVTYKISLTIHTLLNQVDLSCTDSAALYGGFFQYWYNQKELLSLINKQKLFPLFNELFNEYCMKHLSYSFLNEFLEGEKNRNQLRLSHVAFLIGGLCNVLECWVKNNFQTSIDELVKTMVKLAPVI